MCYDRESMKDLELKISVSDYSTLNQHFKDSLMSLESFKPLSLSSQKKLLGEFVSENWLSAEVQNSGVFITPDWVVWIRGKKLIDCVSAMSVLLNSIGEELAAPVIVEVLSHQDKGGESLQRALNREAKIGWIKRSATWAATLLSGGVIGAVIERWIFGDMV